MSEVTSRDQTRNQIAFDYDLTKLCMWDNKYRSVNIANATGSDVDMVMGQTIGSVSGVASVYASETSNQSIIGILVENVTIPANDSRDVTICIAGTVNATIVEDNLNGTDTLDTVVNYRTIRERIEADTLGIELRSVDELSNTDN